MSDHTLKDTNSKSNQESPEDEQLLAYAWAQMREANEEVG